MPAQLESTSASGLGGTGGDLSWSHTIGNLGSNGLILVAGIGREESGEQNPEHINAVYFNGIAMTPVAESGDGETAGELWELHGVQVPAAGTYTVTINYSDSPKQAEKKRGVCAAFRNVFAQAAEASNQMATSSGGNQSLSITPLTPNALVVAAHWWRVGFVESSYAAGFTQAVVNRGDNAAGVSLYYKNVTVPASTSFNVDAGNTESQGILMGAFRSTKRGGGFLAHFM